MDIKTGQAKNLAIRENEAYVGVAKAEKTVKKENLVFLQISGIVVRCTGVSEKKFLVAVYFKDIEIKLQDEIARFIKRQLSPPYPRVVSTI